jgi:DNA-directed RNA polymerase specialized sigma subunit
VTVAEIKELVDDGLYVIDPEAIAEAVIEHGVQIPDRWSRARALRYTTSMTLQEIAEELQTTEAYVSIMLYNNPPRNYNVAKSR